MRSGNRFAHLAVAAALLVPVLADFGCQNLYNVMFRGNQNGGQVQVNGPDLRLNAEGGPNGGRIDLDSPVASIHASGRPRYNAAPPPYRPIPQYPPYRPYGPLSPQNGTAPAATASAQNAPGTQATGGLPALPVEPGTPQAPATSYDGQLASLPQAPAAPDNTSNPEVLDRFAGQQQQKDSSDPNVRAKADPISLEEAASEVAMLDLLNDTRKKSDLSTLTSDKRLDVIARKHSEEMYTLGYFDHKSPVTENRTVGDRFRNAGVSFGKAAENIAMFPYKLGANVQVAGTGRRTAQSPSELARDMMEGYMNSPGHRANILDPQVNRVGLGTVIGSQYAYNTQNFKD